MGQRQIFAAQRQNISASDDRMNVCGQRAQAFDDRRQRDDERFPCRPIRPCRRPPPGSGQRQGEARTCPEFGLHVDAAAKRLHVSFHHIHPDTTAGNVQRPRRPWKMPAGRSDCRSPRRLSVRPRPQAAVPRLGHTFSRLMPRLVGDLDDNASAALCSRQITVPWRACHSDARFRAFDSVIERVSDHVGERVVHF